MSHKINIRARWLLGVLLPSAVTQAQTPFRHVVTIVLENESRNSALQQPFMTELTRKGALLANLSAETHPSQGNYVALTSAALQGVWGDINFDLNVRHIGDLLEAAKLSWKVYAEAYPGSCFKGAQKGSYARKHNPFISYKNVQRDPARCARIVNSSELDRDVEQRSLPEYAFYVPDLNDDGHDTGPAYADKWLAKTFGPRLQDPRFMDGTLVVVTFDENDGSPGNGIYTVLYGDMVAPGSVSRDPLTHYSLLRLIEDNFHLGSLGPNDAKASPIKGVWR